MKTYWVYIMSSATRTLYVGVTGNLARRVQQHKDGTGSAFTKKYHVDRLVFAESTTDVNAAITREKQIKSWTRAKKLALIAEMNTEWRDLNRR